jgi:hypothetical protein
VGGVVVRTDACARSLKELGRQPVEVIDFGPVKAPPPYGQTAAQFDAAGKAAAAYAAAVAETDAANASLPVYDPAGTLPRSLPPPASFAVLCVRLLGSVAHSLSGYP